LIEKCKLQFLLAFDIYVTFISKFKPDFTSLNTQQLTQLKTKYESQLSTLASATRTDFNSNNFVTNFFNAFTHYSNIKLRNNIFIQDILHIKIIELLDFFTQNNFSFTSLSSQSFNSTQTETFKTYLAESQSRIEHTQLLLNTAVNANNSNIENETSRRKTLNDINPTQFVNFENSKDFISSLFNKKHRYENHINIIKTHLQNETTPSSLFYNKFPTPLLNDDPEFVEAHNNLIKEFTTKSMKMSDHFLNNRITIIDNKLSEIKSNLSSLNWTQDFNQKFEDLSKNARKNLEEAFRKANEKALRCKNVPFVAGKHFKKVKINLNNNMSYNDQSSRTNSSFNSSFNTSFRSNGSRQRPSSRNNDNYYRSNYRQERPRYNNNNNHSLNHSSNHSSNHTNNNHNRHYNSHSNSHNTNNSHQHSILRNNRHSTNNNSNFNPYQRNQN
jgi:hypothetical protein